MFDYDEYLKWEEYADRDVESASYLYTMHKPPLEIICYLSQQCAEKMLKAFLVYHNELPEKTHDLQRLCRRCALYFDKFADFNDECAVLTLYATHTRYPQWIELTDEHAKQALKSSLRISDFVKCLIKNKS